MFALTSNPLYAEEKILALAAWSDAVMVHFFFQEAIETQALEINFYDLDESMLRHGLKQSVKDIYFSFPGNVRKQAQLWNMDRPKNDRAAKKISPVLLNLLNYRFPSNKLESIRAFPDLVYWIYRRNSSEPIGAIRVTSFSTKELPPIPGAEKPKNKLEEYSTEGTGQVMLIESFMVNPDQTVQLLRQTRKRLGYHVRWP